MVTCRACEAGLPLIWHVQSRKTMHFAQGLSVVSCKRIEERERVEAHERKQRDVASDRGMEDGRGR